MRCSLCKKKAIINDPKFCKEHFKKYYLKKISNYLKKYSIKNKKLLISVSGGKDSASLAHALNLLKNDFNLELSLFYINLRIEDNHYSQKSLEAVKKLSKKLKISLIVEDLNDYDLRISFFKNSKPCSKCGIIKRYLFNKKAIEFGFDYLVTGHNLDDQYFFLNNNLHNKDKEQLLRTRDFLIKKNKLAGRLKPLIYLTEKENMVYAIINNLPFFNEECPFAKNSPQLLFKNNVIVKRQEKINFVKIIRDIINNLNEEKIKKIDLSEKLHPCKKCGFLTKSEICTFCKLREELQKEKNYKN